MGQKHVMKFKPFWYEKERYGADYLADFLLVRESWIIKNGKQRGQKDSRLRIIYKPTGISWTIKWRNPHRVKKIPRHEAWRMGHVIRNNKRRIVGDMGKEYEAIKYVLLWLPRQGKKRRTKRVVRSRIK